MTPRSPHQTLFLTVKALWLLLVLGGAAPLQAQGDAAFEGMSDVEVLERAIRVYRAEADCDYAIRAYHVLLSRDTTDHIRLASLYNQGMCFERRLFWEEALANYRALVRDFPEHSSALDARFRQGVVLEQLGRYPESERAFRSIPSHPALTASDVRAIDVQLAWQQLMQGKRRSALRRLTSVADEWDKLSMEERRPERFFIGKAHLALGILLSQYAAEMVFVPRGPLEHLSHAVAILTGQENRWLVSRRKERELRLIAARVHYDAAMQQGIPLWVSAAHYQLGSDAERLYRVLNDAPPPTYLNPAQKLDYQAKMKERTRDYLLTASQLYLRGHELAVQTQDGSAWALLLARRVDRVDQEGVDALGEALPIDIWNGESWKRNPMRGDLGGNRAELIGP